MTMAGGRWLGVRLDFLTGIFIGVVALAAILVSQNAGRYICRLCGLVCPYNRIRLHQSQSVSIKFTTNLFSNLLSSDFI